MFKVFVDFIKNKDIRNRILFTLFILFIFRLGAAIPAPGINSIQIDLVSNSILNMMSMLGGGAIEQMSIFALGVGPYITASIIIELLAMDVIPPLAEMAKDGKNGRKRMDAITRYVGVVLAFVQAFFIVRFMNQSYSSTSIPLVENPGFFSYAYIALIMTAGTMFVLWLADQITTKGIGNGVSMIIFAGIVAELPNTFQIVYSTFISGVETPNWLMFVAYIIVYIIILVAVIFVSTSERKIPLQASSSQRLNKTQGDLNYLPFKINSASVIPVIFAGALVQGPLIVSSWINNDAYSFLQKILDFSNPIFLCFYGLLIFLFTFFYTNLQVDPKKVADNLAENGSYIPGVRLGQETREYLSKVLNRITVLGGLLLVVIALLPYIISATTALPQSAAIGGTGIIIAVGVALETIKTLKSMGVSRNYKDFVGK